MQDHLVPIYNRLVQMYVGILINSFIYEIIRLFLTIFGHFFDQIVMIFHD